MSPFSNGGKMREIINFNQNWYFKKNDTVITTISTQMEEINLPHTWNAIDGQDGGNDYYRGTCCYAKKFVKPENLGTRKLFVEFEGVAMSAQVYLNGERVGNHEGGYSTFRIELTEYLTENNVLCVLVDNSVNDRVYPQKADFTFYGGIYRNVNLIMVEPEHFELEVSGTPGIKVTPQVNGNNAVVTVETWQNTDAEVKVTIYDRDGKEVVSARGVGTKENDAYKATLSLNIDDVHLWHGVESPFLYYAVAELIVQDSVVDSVSTRFGCRTLTFDAEKGFFLNGKSYPLRGVSRHQDRDGVGNALTKEMHKEDMEIIKSIGANTVRLAHYQHDQCFYDLCDEEGMIVWAEIPYITQHMPNGRKNTLSQMEELIVQCYNHPSIVCWGLSNEITASGSVTDDLMENHMMLNDLCHKLDQTRPTTMAHVFMLETDSPLIDVPDIGSYNLYFGWYLGELEQNDSFFNEFHHKYPNRVIGFSEYGADANPQYQSECPERGDYTETYQCVYHEHLLKCIGERPYLWATHVWNMFDFAADARAEGGENGMNHKGLVTFDRKYKKDSFYAYQAWLSDKKVLHLCSKKYIDRVEDVTKVTVYSNCDEIELFANGVSVGKQTKGKYPFFYFNVKNEGETTLTVKADGLEDTAVIRKVDTPNESYIMKEEGDVINWFEINMPDGYCSINDTIGDIMSTFGGKIAAIKIILKIKSAFENPDKGSKKEKGKKEGGASVAGFSIAGFDINLDMIKNVYGMAKGFTVKRAFSMIGGKISKEQMLEVNAILNKVKKPKK